MYRVPLPNHGIWFGHNGRIWRTKESQYGGKCWWILENAVEYVVIIEDAIAEARLRLQHFGCSQLPLARRYGVLVGDLRIKMYSHFRFSLFWLSVVQLLSCWGFKPYLKQVVRKRLATHVSAQFIRVLQAYIYTNLVFCRYQHYIFHNLERVVLFSVLCTLKNDYSDIGPD